MPRDDPGLLVVPGSIAGQLEDLGGQVLHHGGQVHGGTSSHSLGVVSLPIESSKHDLRIIIKKKIPQQPVDPAHRELESGPVGARLRLVLHFSSLASARHPELLIRDSETENI